MNTLLNLFPLQYKVGNFRLPSKGSDYAIFFLAGIGLVIGVVIIILLRLNYLKSRNKNKKEEKMICSKCGQELKEGAKFCTKCGNRVAL